MDETLAQILTKLFELQARNQVLTAENEQLKKVVESRLPVHEASDIPRVRDSA